MGKLSTRMAADIATTEGEAASRNRARLRLFTLLKQAQSSDNIDVDDDLIDAIKLARTDLRERELVWLNIAASVREQGQADPDT